MSISTRLHYLLFACLFLTLPIVAYPSWDESMFTQRESMIFKLSPSSPDFIGSLRVYVVQRGDTLLDIARFYDLGVSEVVDANPQVDPWVPSEGEVVLLPTAWLLPASSRRGVVVNIPEMRLYYFRKADSKRGAGPGVITFPVGLGRDDWKTPQGKFRIRGKTVDPTWVLPESIKAERRREEGFAEDFIPAGDPANPLGKYRLELTIPLYALHGTNNPWGVGMQVSHGCVRLYPEDIERLFGMVQVGTPGEFVYEPIKVGRVGDRVLLEAHRDIYKKLENEKQEAVRLLSERGLLERVDTRLMDRVIAQHAGIPVDISKGR